MDQMNIGPEAPKEEEFDDKELIDKFMKDYGYCEKMWFENMTSKVLDICDKGLPKVSGGFNAANANATPIKFELFGRGLRGSDGNPKGSAKSYESMCETLKRRRAQRREPFKSRDEIYQTMYDLSAMTIALYLPHDMDRIDTFIKESFQVEQEIQWPANESSSTADYNPRRGKVPYTLLGEKRMFSGYVGHHYIVRLHDRDIKDDPLILKELYAEIQVKSLVMFSWQKVHHELVYKPGANMPPPTEDDERMLDLANGVIQAGEIALRQLQINYVKRNNELHSTMENPAELISRIEKARQSSTMGPGLAKFAFHFEGAMFKTELFLAIQSVYSRATPTVVDKLLAACGELPDDKVLKSATTGTCYLVENMILMLETSNRDAIEKRISIEQGVDYEMPRSSLSKMARYTIFQACRTTQWILHIKSCAHSLSRASALLPSLEDLADHMVKRPKLENMLALLHPGWDPFKPIGTRLSIEDLWNMVSFGRFLLEYFTSPDLQRKERVSSTGQVAHSLAKLNIFWQKSMMGTNVPGQVRGCEVIRLPWQWSEQIDKNGQGGAKWITTTKQTGIYMWNLDDLKSLSAFDVIPGAVSVPGALLSLLDTSGFVSEMPSTNLGVFKPMMARTEEEDHHHHHHRDPGVKKLNWAYFRGSELGGRTISVGFPELKSYIDAVDS